MGTPDSPFRLPSSRLLMQALRMVVQRGVFHSIPHDLVIANLLELAVRINIQAKCGLDLHSVLRERIEANAEDDG